MRGLTTKQRTPGAFARLLLAAALITGLLPAASFALPDAAYGATPDTVSGNAYVHCVNPGQTNNDGNLFDVTMPDGSVLRGHCIDYGLAYPSDGYYSFRGTWNGASYDVTVDSTGASPHPACVLAGPCQRVGNFTWTPKGAIDLKKTSANPAITNGNSCYSLEGAVYGVYRDRACSDLWFSMSTNADGYWRTAQDIPAGTYWVKETSAPKGYALDPKAYRVDVDPNATARVNGSTVSDVPQNDPAAMWVGKIDLETTLDMPQGSASLEGAEFTIRYYDGQYASAAAAEASGGPTRTWVVKTDKEGLAELKDSYKVSGDDFFRSSTGKVVIPLGTLLIQETKAPKGYVLDDSTVYVRNVTSHGSVEAVETYNPPTVPEQIVRGGVAIEKIDAESGLESPLGAGVLDGATYEIVSKNDGSVRVEGADYGRDEVVKTITAKGYWATTASDTLPFGRYQIREIATEEGYNVNTRPVDFDIVEPGKIVRIEGDKTIANQIKRGDIEFTKKNSSDKTAMANVPFRLTSQTTGESHIVATDENGYASTSAAFNKHTHNTNANDAARDGAYDSTAGIWFGLTQAGTTTMPNDSLGALPYDTYDLEELPCAANAGLQLVKQTGIAVTRDNWIVDLGTLDDPQAAIATTARDGLDADKNLVCDEESSIVDRVAYHGLIVGKKYELGGTVMDKETGKALVVNGEEVRASTSFVAENTSGFVELEFAFDSSALGDKKLVVFERLSCDGRVVAAHEDIDDVEQTVKVAAPKIATSATDGIDADKLVSADTESVIVDTVFYENLIPNKEYELHGTVMDKETGKALVVNGEEVRASTSFAPAEASGSTTLSFSLDTADLGSKKLVVFEKLIKKDRVVAAHEDIGDEGQSVTVVPPEIKTLAQDGFDGDKTVVSDPKTTIIDTVSYKGLVIGKEYVITGKLADKETGAFVQEDGRDLSASTAFVPADTHGTVDVSFELDTTSLAGKTLVAYETLTRNGRTVAAHEDINDEGQAVAIVQSSFHTTATDGLDRDKLVVADGKASIKDEIAYESLLAGEQYTVFGIVLDKTTGYPLIASTIDLEGKTAQAKAYAERMGAAFGLGEFVENEAGGREYRSLIKNDGSAFSPTKPDFVKIGSILEEYALLSASLVSAAKDFTPASASGSEELVFDFDATRFIQAKSPIDTVVCEVLVKDGMVVNVHADIDDKAQTTTIVPSDIATSAADKTDGDRTLIVSKEATITDTVSYRHLIPDKEYKISGVIMDKKTGKPLLVDDKEVTSSATFRPNSADGKIALDFTFDATNLAGTEAVVFETLTKDDVVVATHADINDEAQTVALQKAPEGWFYSKNGKSLFPLFAIAGLLAIAGLASAAAAFSQRKHSAEA